MRTLYIECLMGAAGDMLMSALYELLSDDQKADFLAAMGELGPSGIRLTVEPRSVHNMAGSHIKVEVHGQEENTEFHDLPVHDCGHRLVSLQHHASPGHMAHIIDSLSLPPQVKSHTHAVYNAIAKAEAVAHGCQLGEVHFHEAGALDAVADVVGVCYALYLLAPEKIVVSPIHVGSGTVRCAQSLIPVPAPATALLLSGVPIYGGAVQGELCTPTGAALLVHFADSFGSMPPMQIEKNGYGFGTKSFSQASYLQVFLGEVSESAGT